MIPPELLAEMHRRMASAHAPLTSVVVRCSEIARRTNAIVDKIIERFGASQVAGEVASTERHRRVVDAFRRRDYANLSFKDRRYAAKQFGLATPTEMQGLLERHPECWQEFTNSCFGKYDSLLVHPLRSDFRKLLERGSKHVYLLRGTIRPDQLLSDQGPELVARMFESPNLSVALQDIQDHGYRSSWQFTAVVLATWAKSRIVERRRTGTELWTSVSSNSMAEALLLPGFVGSRSSWFSDNIRPSNACSSVRAQAIFLAALFRASEVGVYWGKLNDRLLSSEFGDPRINSESAGWRSLREHDASLYDWFLKFLISEDIQVFFQHAMTDPRRERFWKRYLTSIRRTVCILERSMHDRLRRLFAASDPKLAGAMSRAKRFTRGGANAQAFVLYFERHVIVEFSETGNASYVYGRADFERVYDEAILRDEISTHSSLKNMGLAAARIVHKNDWEDSAQAQLQGFGIYAGR